jgi:SAM-dependent methyltransferase
MSQSSFWDEKYTQTEHLYSDQPNAFLKKHFDSLAVKSGKVLVPGDGDGRNGLWLAEQGFPVEAFDYSKVAVSKANQQAINRGLTYTSRQLDVSDWKAEANQFDFVVIIFLHLPKNLWQHLLTSSLQTLRPGGSLIIQVFSKDQLGNSSGGPKDLNLLFETREFEEISQAFAQFDLKKDEEPIAEGPLHTGPASMISFKGLSKKSL